MRYSTISAVILSTALATLATACSSTPPGAHPHDMSAAEHREHAAAEDDNATSHEGKHDPNLVVSGTGGETFTYDVTGYNPTDFHRELAVEHKGHADAHRAAAAALEKFENENCGLFPPATRKECPVMDTLSSVDKADNGAVLHFQEKVNKKAALAHVRCHIAFAATQGHKGMDACPLYVKGVKVQAMPNGDITLSVDDAKLVPTLQQRSSDHVHP
jgi:hypothetical protein